MSDKNIIKVYDPAAGEMKTGTANTKKEVLDKIDSLEQGLAEAGKVETVNSVKPDSKKNVELTGSNIKYKADATEDIGAKIDILNSELDTVKQSGVKSNKRMSDKLNSLEISASDKDSISVNVGKFESIPNQGKLDKVITLDDFDNKNPGTHSIINVKKGYYSGGSINIEVPLDDTSGSPGSKVIQTGDKNEGYFGVVPASELITGLELANKVGVTQGTAQYSDTPWHKFAWGNKILFIAQKTIMQAISWAHLKEKDVVYGNKVIEIDGIKYKVRLIKGALTSPSEYGASDKGAKGTEWNRLVAPLSIQRKNNSWDYPAYMESDLQDWGTYISDSELTVRNVNGRCTWCQEVSGGNSSNRIWRGGNGVSSSSSNELFNKNSSQGWRPVLEVVE